MASYNGQPATFSKKAEYVQNLLGAYVWLVIHLGDQSYVYGTGMAHLCTSSGSSLPQWGCVPRTETQFLLRVHLNIKGLIGWAHE